jgi:glycosyltransferase involved in cell wall biosynthesis
LSRVPRDAHPLSRPQPRADGSPPDLTVVVPCHNSTATLVETVRSALDQRDITTDVIVVDDGSTDGPDGVLDEAGLLPAIRFVPQANQGVSVARNTGLELAAASHICFLDSDDILDPRFGSEMLGLLAREQRRLAYCNYRYFDDVPERPDIHIRYPTPEGFIPGRMLAENFIPTPGAVVLARAAIGDLRFDSRRQGTEDWWLWMQLCLREPIAFHPECLIHIRVRPGSLGRRKAAMIRDTAGLFANAEALVSTTTAPLTRHDRARFYYRSASALLDAGESGAAAGAWMKATRLGLGGRDHAKLAGKAALRTVGALRHVERLLWRRRTGR